MKNKSSPGEFAADIDLILAQRHTNGGDYWASADGRIYVGNPFSTIGALGMLYELGLPTTHEAVQGGLDLILNACRADGRIQVAPKAPLYPCYTAEAARMLCRFGLTTHETVQRTMDYLLENVHERGGWRCSFTKFGRGPETAYANPGATLYALDMLRFFPDFHQDNPQVDHAAESLLDHWDSRLPLGPCHHGIGTLFMQVEYPFWRYNLFFYVYVLSFFGRARGDERFGQALTALQARLLPTGEIVVERPHRALKNLAFCARGRPSAPATRRYQEILRNVTILN